MTGSRGTAPAGRSAPAAQSGGTSAGPLTTIAANAPKAGTSGFGYTASTITIGFGYLQGGSALASSLGLPLDDGNTDAMVKALVQRLNADGGIAGRKVVLMEHTYDAQSRFSNADTAASAACADYVSDHQVYAVVDNVDFVPVLIDCLAKKGVPILGADYNFTAASQYAKYPTTMFAPTVPDADRYMAPWVALLQGAGYFGAWDTGAGQPASAVATPVKVGVYYSQHDGQPFGKALLPVLQKLGYPITTFQHVNPGTDPQSAVLQFKTAGVTHVFADSNLAMLELAAATRQQNWYPRYALTTIDAAGGVLETAMTAQQLNGSVGAGWQPARDTDTQHDPGDISPYRAYCRAAMVAGGEDPSNRQHWISMTNICDELNSSAYQPSCTCFRYGATVADF